MFFNLAIRGLSEIYFFLIQISQACIRYVRNVHIRSENWNHKCNLNGIVSCISITQEIALKSAAAIIAITSTYVREIALNIFFFFYVCADFRESVRVSKPAIVRAGTRVEFAEQIILSATLWFYLPAVYKTIGYSLMTCH